MINFGELPTHPKYTYKPIKKPFNYEWLLLIYTLTTYSLTEFAAA